MKNLEVVESESRVQPLIPGIEPLSFDMEAIIRNGRDRFRRLPMYHNGNDGNGIDAQNGDDDIKEVELMRLCELEKNSFIDRYLPYSDDHPVTRYVRSLPIIARNPETKVYVTRRWDDINAVTFPDGSIFLSDRLFTFCEFEDEIESCIYAHERRHAKKKHSLRALQERGIFALLGRKRIDEWEADLAPALEDSDNEYGVNAAGSKIFLERLAEREQKAKKSQEGDIEHGDTYTRLINVERMIRLIDMDALNDDCRKIPSEIVSALESQRDEWQTFKKSLDQRHWKKAQSILTGMSPGEALKALNLIFSTENRISLHKDRMQLEQYVSMMRGVATLKSIVRKKIDDALQEIAQECGDTDPILFSDFLFVNAIPENMLANKLVKEERFWTDVLPRVPRILTALSERLRPASISIFLHAAQQHWKESTTAPGTIYEQGLILRNAFHEAFIDISDTHEFESMDTFLAEKLIESYPREKGMVTDYLRKLTADGLVPSFHLILPRLAQYAGLSHEEEQHLAANADSQTHFTRKDMERAEWLAMDLYYIPLNPAEIINMENIQFTWNDKTIQFKEVLEEDIFEGKSPFSRIDAEELLDSVEKGDFEDFLRVMEATSVLSQERANALYVAAGRISLQSARDIFILYNPVDFHQALITKLGRSLSNEETIRWIEQLSEYHLLTEKYYLLLITGRVFEPSEIAKLAKIHERMSLVVISRHSEKIQARSAYFDFLRFVYVEAFGGHFPDFCDDHSDFLVGEDQDVPTLNDIALAIFRRYDFDMKNSSHLDELLTASCFVTDPNLKLRLQKSVFEGMRKVFPNEQYETILFNDRRVADYSSLDAREKQIDEHIDDPERLCELKRDIVQRVESLEGRHAAPLILKEQISTLMLQDPSKLLRCLLLTGRDETALLAYMAEVPMSFLLPEEYQQGIPGFFNQRHRIDQNLNLIDFFPFHPNLFLDALYSLDYESRFVICHDLLV